MSNTSVSDTEAAPPDAAAARRESIPHTLLERAVSQDRSVIPKLAVLQNVGEVPYVRVGSLVNEDEDEKPEPVYMRPGSKSNAKADEVSHSVRLYWFKDGKAKHVGADSITWLHEVLSWKLFDIKAAHFRWGSSVERKREHSRWLLFVWQHSCGQSLPAGKRGRNEMSDDEEQAQFDSGEEFILRNRPKKSTAKKQKFERQVPTAEHETTKERNKKPITDEIIDLKTNIQILKVNCNDLFADAEAVLAENRSFVTENKSLKSEIKTLKAELKGVKAENEQVKMDVNKLATLQKKMAKELGLHLLLEN